MTTLSQETDNVQNPALGAALLWRFACGYIEGHRTADTAPLPLFFLVLPVLLHQATAQFVKGTQKSSGLRAFATKFSEPKSSKQDVLLAIHDRMVRLRNLSLDSLRVALSTRLVHLDVTGHVLPLSRTRAVAGVPDDARQLMRDAEKLGVWCAQLTLHEVASTLKVRF